eukprot:753135-Hanusia_phi.AAC.4
MTCTCGGNRGCRSSRTLVSAHLMFKSKGSHVGADLGIEILESHINKAKNDLQNTRETVKNWEVLNTPNQDLKNGAKAANADSTYERVLQYNAEQAEERLAPTRQTFTVSTVSATLSKKKRRNSFPGPGIAPTPGRSKPFKQSNSASKERPKSKSKDKKRKYHRFRNVVHHDESRLPEQPSTFPNDSPHQPVSLSFVRAGNALLTFMVADHLASQRESSS